MEESVGQVLLKVQDDLGRLREQLEASSVAVLDGSSGSTTRFDASALQEALVKAETDLRTRSNDVLNRMQVTPVHLPQIHQQQPIQRKDQSHHQKHEHEPLPTVISAKDYKGGLLALMERGEIPPSASVMLEPQPIRHRQAPVHDPDTRPRDRFPADAADPGYTQEGYQLDESKPAKQNGVVKLKLKTSNAACPGKVRLQQFEPPMLRSRSEADRVMQHPPPVAAAAAAAEAAPKSKAAKEVTAAVPRQQSVTAAPPPPTTPASFAAMASRADAPGISRFTIQNGHVRKDASDFQAFQRRCKQLEGIESDLVDRLVEQLERLMQRFTIPMAQVNGELLCDLAELTEPNSTSTDDSELIDCLINRTDVLKLMRRPGRQFVGPGGTERASVVIQKRWRGFLARRDYAKRRRRNQAAKAIADQWKLYTRRLEIRAHLKRTRQMHLDGYKRRFASLQDHWDKWCGKRRVVIHLPSLGYPEKIREGFLNFSRAQNTQMARLCDIRDPNVDVILLSAVAIDDEMTQYYGRLLSGLNGDGQKQQQPVSNRYKIVVPEAAKVFADRSMSLATLLNYSPRALKRIRNLIQGRPAVIIPGYPCQDDLAVADKLDVPILCPEPQVAQLYGTKSGARRIFRAAKVSAPPGDFDIYSLTQLLESLAQLITSNLTVTRWLLKLDSQFDGRGIGFMDVDKLPCYRWALRERRRYGEKWDKKWAQEKVLLRVQEELPELLGSSATRVACPEAYPTWQAFQQEFLSQGGVIEACPPAESVTRLTVDLCIEPSGSVRLLSSGDQLVSAQHPFSCLGISAPQCSVPPAQLNDLCRQVGDACRERRIYGHASVDFVTFEDSETNRQELWATDLSLHYSDTAALSQLFYMATKGRFDPQQHEVFVEKSKTANKSRAPIGRRQRRDRGRRYATMSSRLNHSNLSKLQFAAFFKACRAHGIEFDVNTRTGSLFCLVDPFNRDSVGMATISADLLTSLETFARNLSVIDQEVSTPTDLGDSNFRGLIGELDEVISAAKENEQA
uniref:IQ motif containing H n=2 Tax=Macrostomum lignano TaxID=282301 RepID=A0A1I8J0H5_9PLAT